MKTAEEVAEELALRFETHPLRDERWGVIASEIAQALTAYAEERVYEEKRSYFDKFTLGESIVDQIKQARAEVLKECDERVKEMAETFNRREADMRGKCYSKAAEQDLRNARAEALEEAEIMVKKHPLGGLAISLAVRALKEKP